MALLEPHTSEVWNTFFASFEAFSRSCEQLSMTSATPHFHSRLQTSSSNCPLNSNEVDTESKEPHQSSSRKLLMLLSKCELMQQLLARLLPGFLAVLKCESSVQVGALPHQMISKLHQHDDP